MSCIWNKKVLTKKKPPTRDEVSGCVMTSSDNGTGFWCSTRRKEEGFGNWGDGNTPEWSVIKVMQCCEKNFAHIFERVRNLNDESEAQASNIGVIFRKTKYRNTNQNTKINLCGIPKYEGVNNIKSCHLYILMYFV